MSIGPLGVAYDAVVLPRFEAGTEQTVEIGLHNTGTIAWSESVLLASHWLDDHDNPIVWDGPRNAVPRLAPGAHARVRARVRAPIPPGRYRLALDLVAEFRAWLSELGSPMAIEDVEVVPRAGEPNAALPDGVEPVGDWADRVRAAHADGYAVVAGAIEWDGSLLQRRPHELAGYAPGPGRVPGFSLPLLVPSVLPGIELEPLEPVAGLPAFAAPRGEPWIYDGRAVLRARPRSDRRPG